VEDPPSTRNIEGRSKVNKRLLVLVAMMLVAMMALSGAVLAQGADVCVSNKGDTKVDKGPSTCTSDSTSHAVAVKGSEAIATNSSKARAIKGSRARGR
jgi:hypothetical protein